MSSKLKTSEDIKKDFPQVDVTKVEWKKGAKNYVVTFRRKDCEGKGIWEEVWKIKSKKVMSWAEMEDRVYELLHAVLSSLDSPLSLVLPLCVAECLSRSPILSRSPVVDSVVSPIVDTCADIMDSHVDRKVKSEARISASGDGDGDGVYRDLTELIKRSAPMMTTSTATMTTGTPISATTWGSGPTWEWTSAPDYGYGGYDYGYAAPAASPEPPLYADNIMPHLIRAVEEGKRRDVEMDTVVLDRGVAVSQGLGHAAMILGLRVKYAKEGTLPMDSAFVLLKDEGWEKKEREKEKAIEDRIRKEMREELLKIEKMYEEKEKEMVEEIVRLRDLVTKGASDPDFDPDSLYTPSIDFSSFDTSSVCGFSDSSPESSPASDSGVSVSSTFAYSKEAYDRAVAKAYEEGMEAGKEEKLAEIKKGLKKLPRKEPITRIEFDGELVWECKKKEGAPE